MKKTFFLLLIFISVFSYAQQKEYIICDFDQYMNFRQFKFKDEKGSSLILDPNFKDITQGRCLNIKYDIVEGGWAGWGLGLEGKSFSEYNYLSLKVKGKQGYENFEIGLKSKVNNVERKLNIQNYIAVDTDWQEVRIPLLDFIDVDLSSLDNINISFGDFSKEGEIFVDDIKFLKLETIEKKFSRVLIDGFERINPYDMYIVSVADKSTLKLTSSRFAKTGDYSMEVEYQFISERVWGSWVSATARFKPEMLDWSGTQKIEFWVYGDGSENVLRFNIIETDGEIWSYDDENVLKVTKWSLLSMPIHKFVLATNSPRVDYQLSVDKVKTWQIVIICKTSPTTPLAKTSLSRIYIDQLFLVGENIDITKAQPPGIFEQLRVEVPQIGKVDFSGVFFNEYLNIPEEKSRLSHCVKLAADAKIGIFSARTEILGQWQEFGEAAYYTSSPTVSMIGIKNMSSEISALEIGLNFPTKFIDRIRIGNIWVDYSPFTFAPVWGYKGVTLEGEMKKLNYHMFLVKGRHNSYSVGTKLFTYYNKFLLTGICVFAEDTARLPNLYPLIIKPVSNDLVYTLEVKRKFLKELAEVTLSYGKNLYTKEAEADYSNMFDPVYLYPLEKKYKKEGELLRGKITLKNIVRNGPELTFEYKDIDSEFKPKYRENPVLFDENVSDQRGYNIRISQWYKGFILSCEYDDIVRKDFKDGFRKKFKYGVGYYGIPWMEISVNKEEIRDRNNTKSDRSGFSALDKDEVMNNSHLYVRTKIRDNLFAWFQVFFMDGKWLNSGDSYSIDFFETSLEYFITTNAKFVAGYRTTNYPSPSWEPQGWPYYDNYFRLLLEISF